MIRSACLFCASSNRVPAHWVSAAEELGAGLAARQITLVYGGTNVGLMGAAARAAQAAGGKVVGVIPHVIADAGVAHRGCDELVVTRDLRERKAIMDARSDAFLVLPGGIGTYEELFEMLTLQQLGVRTRPIVLVDLDGAFGPFMALLRDAVERRLAEQWVFRLFASAPDVQGALGALASWDASALPTKFPREA